MPLDHDGEFQGAYFALVIDGIDLGFFTSCSGLSIEFEVIEQKSVGKDAKQKFTTKIPGKTKYGQVTFKRGFTPNADLMKWFQDVAKATDATPYKTGSIVVYDRLAEETARFNLTNMWPSKITASDLNATTDEVMVEELTMEHELLEWA